MSGDVQPRKRKDKKRKKDEPSLEEHRGTSATFGDGDVQIHSQHDHGTGGHWCAKIIFFSLLAVLVTLIGLIILENRGLSELEANAVESQYSGLLDGWIEDTPEDDHHDEHTLELKHHEHDEDGDDDDDDDEHGSVIDEELEDHDQDNDDEQVDEVDHDEVDDEDDEDREDVDDGEDEENDEDEDDNESKEIDEDDENEDEDEPEQRLENDDDDEDGDEDIEEPNSRTEANYDDDEDDDDDDDDDEYNKDTEDHDDDDENPEDNNDNREDMGTDDDISDEVANNDGDYDDDDEVNAQSVENDDYDQNEGNSEEEQDDEDVDEHDEDHEEEAEEEIEKIEKEVLDQEEPESAELALPDVSGEKEEETSVEAVSPDEEYEVDEREFLEMDELDEPAVERIAPPPPGKPFLEIEEVSVEAPPDGLAEEEEYEKQQEELREQEEAQSSHMWLKLAVGGALLAATHAVLRRATAPRDAPESEQDDHVSREDTPLTDRRMTLIPDETSKVIPPQSIQPKVEEEIVQKISSVVKAAPVKKQDSEELDDEISLDEEVDEDQEVQVKKNDDEHKELYSDDEEIEVDEDVDEEEELEEKKEAPKSILKVPAAKIEDDSKSEEVPDDVEIIDEEIEEEVDEEVEDEEEISDVDDAELLSRLEAKYGRLPEPERPGQKHKDGGNSVEDEWPGEPSDPYWRQQLDKAEQELRQGALVACEARAGAAPLADSARARWLRARALDALAEARRDNRELARAIAAYRALLDMSDRLSDRQLRLVALRTIDRIHFRGTYINAEPIYRLLIRRFPNDVTYRNNLTISFLMANRADLASEVLQETLRRWPADRVALAHYGFVLKTEGSRLEEAVGYLRRALAGDAGAANEPRFYYHLGDALLLLGRREEADEVHRRGAALGHFPSPWQRSLYNVARLRAAPWWDVRATPYAPLARRLEAAWRDILKEGEAAAALYEQEREGLRERGAWSQLELLARGRELPGRCARAPVTCRLVATEPAARCRRGQVKFSLLSGGSHVRAHVGPTNCRLRMHLALSNTEGAYLRVANETRQWEVGKVLMFDDSFEHEVWHNGTAPRLVLIVDVWHPDLTPEERRTLPAI